MAESLVYRRALRAYADTSVYGGAFDEGQDFGSRLFLRQAVDGRFTLVYSPLIVRELAKAPAHVKSLFRQCLPFAEPVDMTDEAMDLRNAYLRQTIVSLRYRTDALHGALAIHSPLEVVDYGTEED